MTETTLYYTLKKWRKKTEKEVLQKDIKESNEVGWSVIPKYKWFRIISDSEIKK